MKCMTLLIASTLLFASAARANENSAYLRLLLHGHRELKAGFGAAGWIIAPNLSSSLATWLALAGPRYDGAEWNVEALVGAVVDGDKGKLVVDLRLELTPKLWNTPIYFWHNLQWVATGGRGAFYWYSQLDWVAPKGLVLLGVETENTISAGAKDFSLGPHAILPLSNLVLIAAPQFHFSVNEYSGFQMWLRAVVNL